MYDGSRSTGWSERVVGDELEVCADAGYRRYMRWAIAMTVAGLVLGCEEQGVCTTEVIQLEVEVQGLGEPPRAAEVVALNVGTQALKRFTVVDGRAVISESIGAGDFRIWAEDENGFVSGTFMVQWTCDECHCIPEQRLLIVSMH
jgi:hypothetical protein